ncbi:uncharacterized protein BX664DRAFT_12834 [Halteromyces radiatus]|uniref:uncharacterized protein n=1 Tax=Halteromyces radiatus TaxID=101107 RepID=UPI00221FFC21|nr:uncharacterized protein BX664DRAFT_12834 [Halteromyces radiatus]KAI8099088.1 hypothetical protein BX664DRAFT_12834 [Halteromyces radiatus]
MEDLKEKDHFPLSGSSDQLEIGSILFISPTIILSFIILFSLGRLLHTRASPWIDIDVQATRSRSWTAFTKLIIVLCIGVNLTFLIDASSMIARVMETSVWISKLLIFYEAASFMAWMVCLWTLLDELYKFGQIYWIQYIFWCVALLTETSVGWLWALSIKHPKPDTSFTIYDQFLLGVFITRYVLECLLFVFSIIHMFSQTSSSAETTPLLNSTNHSDYGSAPTITTTTNEKPKSTFSDFFKKMGDLMPFIWPHNNWRLQALVILSFGLMVLGLFINAQTPFQLGYVVDHIGKGKFAWAAVLIYMGFKFLQGGSGLIQCVQNFLWVPVNQYTTREISIKLFEHLHLLSLNFHLNRKTGEVLRVMDRGTSSVVQLLSQILFQIVPAIANILVAVVLFTITFSPAYGAIVFVTMSLYLYVTITMTEWRTKFRRSMIELDNAARTKSVDSLLNFETVKYYGNSDYEINRYRDAIVEYQKADWQSSVSLNILNLAQNTVITAGLFVGCMLFAWEVSLGRLTAGDFVIFNVYMMQLYSPLHWFGTYYRMIQTNFIDMEKMLDLFKEEQTVKDIPGAPDIVIKEGNIVFDNVTFTYDNRQTALNGVSFTAPAGSTVALVGPSGSGKSTIMRLLFRFYDPTTGTISIDGQNIRNVKQASLRRNIGVVPQDCVLFNDTIMYNLQYGDIHASKEDVYEAAKAAQIHDKILSFPDGYETKVGERGLRLSTGEKQRVAIGRTILKNPPIILLDEATSSLDTLTERQIQLALSNVTKDRTTVVIAHRLSTIVNADLILVIKDGRVVESGTHDELLKQGASSADQPGVYWEMWQKQLREDNDTDSTSTIGDLKTKINKDDDTLLTSNETAKLAHQVEETILDPITPSKQQQQQQQQQQQEEQQREMETVLEQGDSDQAQSTTITHSLDDIPATTNDYTMITQQQPQQQQEEELRAKLPPLDIPSKINDTTTGDDLVSSPVDENTTLQNDQTTNPVSTSPTNSAPKQDQQQTQSSQQSQQGNNKSKSRSKNNKKKKRKSGRNSTTF